MALGREFGVHRHTVAEHLRTRAVDRHARELTTELVDQAVGLYERGMSLERIGRRLGASAGTVRKELKLRGIVMRTSYDHLLR